MSDIDYVNVYVQKLNEEVSSLYRMKIVNETKMKISEDALNSKQKECEELKESNENLNNLLVQASNSIEDLTSKKIKFESDLDRLHNEIKDLRNVHDEHMRIISQREKDLETKTKEAADFKNELSRQTNEMSTMYAELQELKKKLAVLTPPETKKELPIKKKTKEIISEDTF